MSTAISIEAVAIQLAKKMEIYQCNNTTDLGDWKTKAAEATYNRMQKQLDKLDAQIDELQ